jgi:hypothetical protein
LQDSDFSLAEGSISGWPNVYRRDICAGGGYTQLAPLEAPSQERIYEFHPEIQGFSADGSTAIMVSKGRPAPVRLGARLTCATRTSATTIAFQWLRNGEPIAGAKTANRIIAEADLGKTIQCQVTATNANAGSTAVANPVVRVEPVPGTRPPVAPPHIAAPTTSGALGVGGGGGQTLSCDPDAEGWSGSPSFAYQWYRNGVAIAGATAEKYVVTGGDLASAAAFQCAVRATNAGGTTVQVSANLLSSPAPAEPPAPKAEASMPGEEEQLYEAHTEGGTTSLRGVCVQPNGRALVGDCAAGTLGDHYNRRGLLTHAISEDGSVIYWMAIVSSSSSGTTGKLFARVDGSETIPVSEGEGAAFLAASADGSKAIFSDKDWLQQGGIRLFSLASKSSKAIGVGRFVGASSDLSHIYLVSSEAKAAGATVGQPNLYLYESESDAFTFIATLSSADLLERFSPVDGRPTRRGAQVNADGTAVAFMSRARPGFGGYDNTDQNSGAADYEVYLWRAGTGTLVCVSCMPTGARPTGRLFTGTNNFQIWVSGSLPLALSQLHYPHVLSEDGNRLFFHSFDPLSLRDTNGKQDVYEWEALGAGNCEEESLGFSEAAEGCVNLISTGESPSDSELVDASADGRDVFFKTNDSLDARDTGLLDIYDARVDGGFADPPEPVAACEGEACQNAPEAPNDPSPSSLTFEGAGNVVEAPAARKPSPCAKGKVRRHGKCVSRHRHKRKARRHGRAGR